MDEPEYLKAVNDWLISMFLSPIKETDSFMEAREKIKRGVRMEIAIATDPEVNGGYELVKKEEVSNG